MSISIATISYAQEKDLPRVVSLFMKRAEEFDFESHGFPRPELEVLADTVRKNWFIAPCIVAKNEAGDIIGAASLNIISFGWSRQPVLSPFMVYVLPNERNYGTIEAIYSKIKEYADLQGILYADDYIAIDRVDGRRRLMRRLGFKEAGFLLTYKKDK